MGHSVHDHVINGAFHYNSSKVRFSEFRSDLVIRNAPWKLEFQVGQVGKTSTSPRLQLNIAVDFYLNVWKLCSTPFINRLVCFFVSLESQNDIILQHPPLHMLFYALKCKLLAGLG